MKKLEQIFSIRNKTSYPSHKIVLEWEEILSESLNLPIVTENPLWDKFYRRFEKNGLTNLYHKLVPKRNLRLDFEMCAVTRKMCKFNKNTIPVIIDFWLKEEEIPAFISAYKHCPLILLTNREVYNLLKKHSCPIPIEHWPLSFPDYYALNENINYEKKYDFTIIGRPNPFFIRFLERYVIEHPDFSYIMNNGDILNRHYINNRGEIVDSGNSREDYLNVIRATRISCYTTPGIDEAKKDSNQYNQVTPRVFELLSNECHVIGHYPKEGEDIKWYRLDEIVPNVDNYEEFALQLDRMRKEPFDKEKVSQFMRKHYTSTRAIMLKEILKKHGIEI